VLTLRGRCGEGSDEYSGLNDTIVDGINFLLKLWRGQAYGRCHVFSVALRRTLIVANQPKNWDTDQCRWWIPTPFYKENIDSNNKWRVLDPCKWNMAFLHWKINLFQLRNTGLSRQCKVADWVLDSWIFLETGYSPY
jgi:hypothetical protein